MIFPAKKFLEEKIELIAREKMVLDIGGGERFQKWLAPYRDFFVSCEYKTFDYNVRSGADIIGDIHNIPMEDESVDAIICSSVLEHVHDPMVAVSEMHRILKRGGKMLVYVPSIYPYHARRGHYPDYWRFFDDTIILLFKKFAHSEIQKTGGYFKALSYFMPYQSRMRRTLDFFSDVLDVLCKACTKTATPGYFVYLIK